MTLFGVNFSIFHTHIAEIDNDNKCIHVCIPICIAQINANTNAHVHNSNCLPLSHDNHLYGVFCFNWFHWQWCSITANANANAFCAHAHGPWTFLTLCVKIGAARGRKRIAAVYLWLKCVQEISLSHILSIIFYAIMILSSLPIINSILALMSLFTVDSTCIHTYTHKRERERYMKSDEFSWLFLSNRQRCRCDFDVLNVNIIYKPRLFAICRIEMQSFRLINSRL